MKEKIKAVVEKYIEQYPEDYLGTVAIVEEDRTKLRDTQFGQGEMGYAAMYTISEILSNMIAAALEPEEKQEFQKLDNKKWFANTYPQFRLPDEV